MSDSPRKILVTSALPYANGSPHMGHLVEYIQTDIWVRFQALRDSGDIYTRTIEQSYDEQEGMFLPDRFVKGTCPRCKTEDQYGDACEACGATYAPEDLIDPDSVLSGTTPVKRESEHYFFRLSEYEERLRHWMSV